MTIEWEEEDNRNGLRFIKKTEPIKIIMLITVIIEIFGMIQQATPTNPVTLKMKKIATNRTSKDSMEGIMI